MPEDPKQETSLLAFPETRDHVVGWQMVGRVAPGVMVFVAVVVNDFEQAENDAENRNYVYDKSPATQQFPIELILAQWLLIRRHKVRQRRNDCGHKRQNNAKVPQIADKCIDHSYLIKN